MIFAIQFPTTEHARRFKQRLDNPPPLWRDLADSISSQQIGPTVQGAASQLWLARLVESLAEPFHGAPLTLQVARRNEKQTTRPEPSSGQQSPTNEGD